MLIQLARMHTFMLRNAGQGIEGFLSSPLRTYVTIALATNMID